MNYDLVINENNKKLVAIIDLGKTIQNKTIPDMELSFQVHNKNLGIIQKIRNIQTTIGHVSNHNLPSIDQTIENIEDISEQILKNDFDNKETYKKMLATLKSEQLKTKAIIEDLRNKQKEDERLRFKRLPPYNK